MVNILGLKFQVNYLPCQASDFLLSCKKKEKEKEKEKEREQEKEQEQEKEENVSKNVSKNVCGKKKKKKPFIPINNFN